MTRAPTFPSSAARSTIFAPASGGGGGVGAASPFPAPHACSASGLCPFNASAAAALELSRIGDAEACAPSAGKRTGRTLFRTNPFVVRVDRGAWRQSTAVARFDEKESGDVILSVLQTFVV